MIAKKICMIGAFSVGKTSLVERFVNSIFSDHYLSTVGVKISKKQFAVDGQELSLILWDMEGKDDFSDVKLDYLRGAMGFFMVADGTCRSTLETALNLRSKAMEIAGPLPNILLLNKCDLKECWEISPAEIAAMESEGIRILHTSAKTGENVEEAFRALARAMLNPTPDKRA